jgi:segregation and condensation protein A
LLAFDLTTSAVHTAVFDGPLELLLFLVRREGVDIREVSIATIADAFLAQLDDLSVLDLDQAGDFVVMASTLCFLKSRELLPRAPALVSDDEEASQIREELHRRLQEYERYREASEALAQRPWLDRDTWAPCPEPVEGRERPVEPGADAFGLLSLYLELLVRRAAEPPVHEVRREQRSMRDVADDLLRRLEDEPMELADLLFGLSDVGARVMAILAVLELARLRLISLEQDHHLSPIRVARRPEADALSALDTLHLLGDGLVGAGG